MFEMIFGLIVSAIAGWLISRHYYLKGIRSAEIEEVTYKIREEPLEITETPPELSGFEKSEAFMEKVEKILKSRGMTFHDLENSKGREIKGGTREVVKEITKEMVIMYLKEKREKIEPDIVEELTERLLSSTVTEEEIKRAKDRVKEERDLIKGTKLVHKFDEIELVRKKISDTEYQITIRPKR